MSVIADNIHALRAHLDAAPTTIIAIGKTFPAQMVREAAAAGITDFGENYLQEAEDKIAATADLPLIWHFIGAVQSNKTTRIAALFDWVHGVDRLTVGRRLSAAREGKPPINIFMQVNIGSEITKAGVSVDGAPALAADLTTLPNVRLRGLMALPPATNTPAQQYAAFRQVADLQAALVGDGYRLDCLSLGMSADYEQALRVGATHIRLGTAIFGKRDKKVTR